MHTTKPSLPVTSGYEASKARQNEPLNKGTESSATDTTGLLWVNGSIAQKVPITSCKTLYGSERAREQQRNCLEGTKNTCRTE